jgi:hypothetical protein
MMLKASESGILDADEIADIKSDVTITGDKYLQEYECDFNIANPGAIFLEEVELARKDGRINNDIMHYAGLPVYTAFDIGLPINTKCWVFQIVGDKIKMLMHLSGNPKINTPHKWVHLLTELGKERGYSYGVHFLPHDGETVWRPVFQDAGFDNTEVLEKSKDAWDYINVAKEDFGRVWISEKECQSGIRGLEFWSTIETKKKAYNSNTPAHDWSSHVCTAFCYAMLAIRRGRTINKAGMHKKGQRRGGVRVRTGSFGSNSGFKGKVIR